MVVHKSTQRYAHNPTEEDRKRTIFNKIESPVFTWQFRLRMTKTRRDVAAKGKNFDIQKVSRKTD